MLIVRVLRDNLTKAYSDFTIRLDSYSLPMSMTLDHIII